MSEQIDIKVVPGSSRERVGPLMADGTLKLAVTAPAENNKANEAVIALLAKTLGVDRAAVHIASGRSSPRKTIEVRGWTAEQIRTELKARADGSAD